ncbi:hypothetical protein [Kitasatospora griseola]|uniref:hypothetical protein n=1 Tax=Kitasatospora griseola TaxID=2064 RepID=UPI00341F67BE
MTADDVPVLADLGLLRRLGEFEGHPTYGALEAEQWADTDALAAVVADRTSWIAASLSTTRAAESVPWAETEAEFRWTAEQRGLEPGRLGRWGTTDVHALAADAQLAERVEGRRLIPGERAADYLDIDYARDWPYVVAAGWISSVGTHHKSVGTVRTVKVALYRTADVLALRERNGVDWRPYGPLPRAGPRPCGPSRPSCRAAPNSPAAWKPRWPSSTVCPSTCSTTTCRTRGTSPRAARTASS